MAPSLPKFTKKLEVVKRLYLETEMELVDASQSQSRNDPWSREEKCLSVNRFFCASYLSLKKKIDLRPFDGRI
ncbi:hypothetical protein SAMN02799624_04940 [Paenibacillus sp. UNC496MF]|nr:hypothetical protein SAMN02799624_04940 [Paenibacillus sp. UNC496MF]